LSWLIGLDIGVFARCWRREWQLTGSSRLKRKRFWLLRPNNGLDPLAQAALRFTVRRLQEWPARLAQEEAKGTAPLELALAQLATERRQSRGQREASALTVLPLALAALEAWLAA